MRSTTLVNRSDIDVAERSKKSLRRISDCYSIPRAAAASMAAAVYIFCGNPLKQHWS